MEYTLVNIAKSADMIADRVYDLIASGSLKPGQKLPSERKLAKQFSSTRASAKQAIVVMKHRGMIESQWKTRHIICDIFTPNFTDSMENIVNKNGDLTTDAVEMRYILEIEATKLAAKRRTVRDLENIAAAYNDLILAGDNNDFLAQVKADALFHMSIAEASHNNVLVYVMRSMVSLIEIDITKSVDKIIKEPNGQSMIDTEHHELYQAILLGDVDSAELAARTHLAYYARRLSGNLDFEHTQTKH